MGSSCQNVVLNAFSDVDIYENIKQTSTSQMASKNMIISLQYIQPILLQRNVKICNMFQKKKNHISEITSHREVCFIFHKCPHLRKHAISNFGNQSPFQLELQPSTFVQLNVRDPVSSEIDKFPLKQFIFSSK